MPDVAFAGYDISATAISMAQAHSTSRLKFHCRDLLADSARFDVLLAIDVFEHVSDYMGFLRQLRAHGDAFIFHIPLDLSVAALVRPSRLTTTRRISGHLHYFATETALATLRDTGYEVVSWRLTAGALEAPQHSMKTHIANIPRRIIGTFSRAWAARLLGGYSLLVVAH